MGWLYPYHTTTKKLLVEDVLATWKRCEGIVHATKCVKDGMWILGTPKGFDKPFIGFYLMKKAQGLWGYKDMEEACHPYYYDCPIDWLDKAAVMNQSWRDGVIKHHSDKAAVKLARTKLVKDKSYLVGGSWRLHGNNITEVFVISTKPLRGAAYGYTFPIPRKMVACMSDKP